MTPFAAPCHLATSGGFLRRPGTPSDAIRGCGVDEADPHTGLTGQALGARGVSEGEATPAVGSATLLGRIGDEGFGFVHRSILLVGGGGGG
jgi:hypothetical protein